MTTDELVVAIEEFMTTYDPYGFYDIYDSWKPTDKSFEDIKNQVVSKDSHMIAWFEDVANNSDDSSERADAEVIYRGLTGGDLKACTLVNSSTDIFGEDPDFFFTRDDIIDYIETPLESQIPEIESCRGYIDKEDDKYVLSVDIITEDYDLTGGAAPAVTIDMRKIRKPSDLGKYLTPIIQIYNDTVDSFNELADQALDPYFDDPTQYGNLEDPITPWGGSCL